MRYPVEKATSVPGSGNAFYMHLIENISIPAKLTHELWYRGCEELVQDQQKHSKVFFQLELH